MQFSDAVKIFFSIFCLKVVNFREIYAYDILAFFTMKANSHKAVTFSLTTELAKRGHNVEVYTAFPAPENEKRIPNYREIDISTCLAEVYPHDINQFGNSDLFLAAEFFLSQWKKYKFLTKCAPVMDLIRSSKRFDAVIVEPFDTDLFSSFTARFNATLINIYSSVLPFYLLERMGSPSSVCCYRGSMMDIPKDFFTKVANFLFYLCEKYFNLYYNFNKAEMFRKILFGDEGPTLEEVLGRTSLILSNSHFTISQPLPLVPGIVEVGGIHIGNASELPQNIEKFINESKHGVVYFCMGSLLRGETFPPEKREAFLYAFSKIPQRVLWKWEGDVLPGKSDNIMISKWMPQRDILAHPNVKLFISHGGLLGTSEAVYEGVPVLGIPIFGDQRTNIKSLEANGAGELLDYNEISKEVVLEKIQRLLNDPKYKENAKLLSDRYRDRPMSPLDTAVYWTEYVIRHKGAPHLRTAAADMPWYQYLLLDVIAFLVAILIAGLLIVYYSIKFTLRFIRRLICGGDKKSSSKSDKKKRN